MRTGASACSFVTRSAQRHTSNSQSVSSHACASCMDECTSSSEPPPNLTPPPPHTPQCVANCLSCASAGQGKCDAGSCASGYGLWLRPGTFTSTCAPVRQHAPFDLLRNPACARIRNRASSEPPPTLTPLPAHAPQCAPNCAACSTAGAGACDAGSCATGYGLYGLISFTSKCAPVRQRASFDLFRNPACARIRPLASD